MNSNIDNNHKMMCKSVLYIIGNGFDVHHGMNTSYKNFREWVYKNCHNDIQYAFIIHQLEFLFDAKSNLWSEFEYEMGRYDREKIAIQRFGPYPEVLIIEDMDVTRRVIFSYNMRYLETITDALTSLFRHWVSNIDIAKEQDKSLDLSDTALYLTFNYTDTLEKLYGISPNNILHIHGSILNSYEPLIVGHNNYIDPTKVIIDGNDFRDNNERMERIDEMNNHVKPCKRIIDKHTSFFNQLSQIKKIVILGCSYSDIDLPYFKEIRSKVAPDACWEMGWHNEDDLRKSIIYQEKLHLNESHVIHFYF